MMVYCIVGYADGQGSHVRCPGDTIHFGYQKYTQLILLLSERQISTEKVKQSESWTNGLCWYLWVISWLRAHRVTAKIVLTVDNGEEFYIPRSFKFHSEIQLLDEAMGYMYYYNNVREHSSLNYQTPFQALKQQLPGVDDAIRYIIPVMLDKAAVEIGPWSGYNVLAQYRMSIFKE